MRASQGVSGGRGPGAAGCPWGGVCGADLERTRLEPGGERKGGRERRGQDPGVGEQQKQQASKEPPLSPGSITYHSLYFGRKVFMGH